MLNISVDKLKTFNNISRYIPMIDTRKLSWS